MTVGELIAQLSIMDPSKPVELGTLVSSFGKAMWVTEYDDYVEIESDSDY